MKGKNFTCAFCTILFAAVFGAMTVFPQTTEFSYQGFLNDNSASANGNYDFEFRLFENANGGVALVTQARPNVPVTNGVFSVVLDFSSFPAANRFLEIGVRPAGGGALITLAPRSKLLSTPYATNAINAQNAATATTAQNSTNAQNASQLGGVAANQFVQTVDPRLSDARSPLPNSPNYIQNSTAPQPATNFNISGNGTTGGTLTGNVVSATTQFNIGNSRVLSSPGSSNFFAGNNAGFTNSTGTGNSFFGINAGTFNTTGGNNTFAGFEAGRNNNAGTNNSYFGKDAGRLNNTGNDNAFFGNDAGQSNTSGGSNSFFGKGAGASNTTAAGNSFFGALAGNSNTIGENNAFFGSDAGMNNTSGDGNSFFGKGAGAEGASNFRNSFFGAFAGNKNNDSGDNTFVGYEAGSQNVDSFYNSYFGSLAGKLATGSQNSFFGSLAGGVTTTGTGNTFVGKASGRSNTTGDSNTFLGVETAFNSAGGDGNTFLGSYTGYENISGSENTLVGFAADFLLDNLTNATAIGAKAFVGQSNALILGSIVGVNGATNSTNVGIGTTTPRERLDVNGIIRVTALGAAGSTTLCRNINLNQISTCSSSLRYKTDIAPFSTGLNLVNRLRPITFNWKEGGMHDLGLGAEDVAAVEPLLVTYNDQGEVEGVKYDRVAVVLLNAVKEQQSQIERQQTLIEEQKKQLAAQQAQMQRQEKRAEAQQTQLDRQTAEITGLAQTMKRQISNSSTKRVVKRNKK